MSPLDAPDAPPERPRWYARLAAIGASEGESSYVSLSRRILLLGGALMSGGGLLWGAIAATYGLWVPAVAPFAYTALTALNFGVFARTRNFRVARFVQVFLSLLLPFVFQWSLGGFMTSGAMMLWAMIAIVGSLSFSETRASVTWLALYAALAIASGVCEATFARHAPFAPSDGARTLFFVLNIVTISGIVFGLFIYYAHQRQLAIAELEEERERTRTLMENLSEARLRAEEATRAKASFLANMSHEIRTPMNAVIGLSHLALGGELATKQRDYVEKVHRAGTALLGIVDDILDFSKLESGSMKLERIAFDVEELTVHVTSVVQHRLEQKRLALLVELDPDLPRRLLGDPLRLGQVLVNLLGNAAKFTEAGAIALSLRRGEVVPEDAEDGHVRVRIAVRDTGIGMSPEQRAQLFRPFVQADVSTTRRFGGTGLGLSISDRLVRAMGGEFSVESEVGVGSTFAFEIPLGVSAGDASTGDAAALALASGSPRMRALVVGPPGASRAWLTARLGEHLPVEMADTAEAGVAAIAAQRFDLVAITGRGAVDAAPALRDAAGRAARLVLVASGEAPRSELAVDGQLDEPTTTTKLWDLVGTLLTGQPSSRSIPPTRPVDARLDGLLVLLAEDNAVNAEIAVANLEQHGVRVFVAGDGAAAVAALREGRRFDLVLMDVQMPVMDGHTAARTLRAEGFTLPIVAMTAHALAEDRALALAAGMNDHLTKPLDPARLRECIARWCGRATADAPAPARRERTEPASVLDVVDGVGRVAGREEVYARLLARTVESHADAPSTLRAAIESARFEDAHRLAHTLRGVFANLGARALAAELANLESELRGQGSGPLVAVERLLRATLDEMRAWLAARPEATTSALAAADEPSGAATLDTLVAIDALLADSNTEAVEAAERGAPALRLALGAEAAARLLQHARSFDFEEARALLAPALATPSDAVR